MTTCIKCNEPKEIVGRGMCRKCYHYWLYRTPPNERSKIEKTAQWRGGIMKNGYVRESGRTDRKYLHRVIMEKALGRELKQDEAVHHIDGNRQNNNIGNLMVFANRSMHDSFHFRLRAFEACGNYEWRQCKHCHQWDDTKNLYIDPKGVSAHHRKCLNEYNRKRKLLKAKAINQLFGGR